jgi:hypothetical protein
MNYDIKDSFCHKLCKFFFNNCHKLLRDLSCLYNCSVRGRFSFAIVALRLVTLQNFTKKIKTVWSFEILVTTYETNPEDHSTNFPLMPPTERSGELSD